MRVWLQRLTPSGIVVAVFGTIVLGTVFSAGPAGATLIGDQITIDLTWDSGQASGTPVNESPTVIDPGVEFSTNNFGPLNFAFTDLQADVSASAIDLVLFAGTEDPAQEHRPDEARPQGRDDGNDEPGTSGANETT